MAREVNLWADNQAVAMQDFVQKFIDYTISGILRALKATSDINSLSLTIDGQRIAINLNGADVPMNAFVGDIVRKTVAGMVSSLKGVNSTDKVTITINA